MVGRIDRPRASFPTKQGRIDIDPGCRDYERHQFRGAMETLKVLPCRSPQLLQRSFCSRLSNLVYGGRPCRSSLTSIWVRFPQTAQVATITCQARRSSSRIA